MSWLVYLFFFASGFSSLIYEVLWTRLFVLVMGGTVYSFTTVLVAFMSGLALGGFIGGRYADRMKQNPLVVYGILEGLIGFYCLFIPSLINLLNPVFDALYPFLLQHNFVGLLVRFFFSSLILLLPCSLMGATLPILVRFQYEKQKQLGKTTGLLYGCNTLGAVLGSFVSGMILLPNLGQARTLYLGAGINFSIFFLVLGLSARKQWEFISLRLKEDSERVSHLTMRSGLILFGYGLSGMVAMVYQVVWTRALILSLGTTLYVLSLILTSYIGGLALGAFVSTLIVERLKRLWLWTGLIEMGIGVSAWLVVPVLARLPVWIVDVYRPASYSGWLGIEFLIGTALILVPTFLMGSLVPLVVRLYREVGGGIGTAVGAVYAWNTIGAILGSFLCGFLLIKWLGLRNSLILASILSLGIGLGFFLGERILLRTRLTVALGIGLLIFLLSYYQPAWSPVLLNIAPYFYYSGPRVESQGLKSFIQMLNERGRVLYHREGTEAVVSVFQYFNQDISLRINGKADASTGDDMPTQILLGQIPMLLHPSPKKVAVIGLASGVTLGSVLTHPVEEAVCLEISPEVVEASRYFDFVNGKPLEDPRTRLIINDARYHLAHTQEKYDVIISEPSNPWISGMGLLFTKEFYALAKKRLNPGGIMVSWVGIYDLDQQIIQMIARSFLESFPNATLWESLPGSDYLFIGFNGPLELDYQLIKKRLAKKQVNEDLKKIHLAYPAGILGRMILGPEELRAFADNAPLHTDDQRQLELLVPRLLYKSHTEQRLLSTFQAFSKLMRGPEPYLKFGSEVLDSEREAVARAYQAEKLILEFIISRIFGLSLDEQIEHLLKIYQLIPDDLWLQKKLFHNFYIKFRQSRNMGQLDRSMKYLGKAWEYYPEDSPIIPSVISLYWVRKGDLATAKEWMEKALKANDSDPLAWMVKGKIEIKQGDFKTAFESLQKAMSQWPLLESLLKSSREEILLEGQESLRAELLFCLGEIYQEMGDFRNALSYFEQTLSLQPSHLEGLIASGKIFLLQKDLELAVSLFTKAVRISPRNPEAHLFLARSLEQIPSRMAEAIWEYQLFLNFASEDFPEKVKIKKHLSELKSKK